MVSDGVKPSGETMQASALGKPTASTSSRRRSSKTVCAPPTSTNSRIKCCLFCFETRGTDEGEGWMLALKERREPSGRFCFARTLRR
jgi:hypothetical protein